MVKIPPIRIAIVNGHFRPSNSDVGAQISGPVANPRTYRLVPNVPTSDPTLNSLQALLIAGEKIALVNDTTKVPLHTRDEVKSLRYYQLWASSDVYSVVEIGALLGELPIIGMQRIIQSIKLHGILLGI